MLDRHWQPTTPSEPLATRSRTIAELFTQRAERDATRVAIKQRQGDDWRPTTWQAFHDSAAAIAAFLMEQGIQPGDKVCIVGSTGAQWCYADIGGHLAGAVTLGAYPTSTPAQLAYILDHSDTRVAFVEGAEQVDKLLSVRGELPRLERVCVWNHEGLDQLVADSDWLVSFADALSRTPDRARIDERVAAIDPESTAIIIYTSGTTGPPKGAMLSHRNILALLDSLQRTTEMDRDDTSFAFLPMAHAAERNVGFYMRINHGTTVYFATSIASVLDEVQSARPTVFGSVPRIFEKAYGRIMGQVESAPPMRQKIFRWAERVGREVVRRWQRGDSAPRHLRLQHQLADRLVFSKIRSVFGGQVRHFVTGAAPIALEILEFFWAAGFPIYEVYGMTECTAVSHGNRPGDIRLGSVGRPLPWAEVRIAEDGEILVRGACVFQGYYKNPEATAETIDAEGWLHTGDIGKMDSEGYLYIVDRKKHIIITSGGKNLTPANIENEIKAADPMISQVHAHGDKRAYLTALITLGPAESVEYARARGMVGAAEAERILAALRENPLGQPEGLSVIMDKVVADTELMARIAGAVRRANRELARVEGIKRVHILAREFSMAEDEITPTLKVKRKNIEIRYADIFDRLYSDSSFGIDTSS
jgi:long-chain acyl-CoA synthetase